ncbi:MAG TPA: quinol:cytochrome C oxidoreductase [Candidatus Krumholzibacteria bacterium]|nr:quinol:cytochrome C oxidoreductase [Candidatus Krumholzibacteria bacterium]HPD70721.1 quinol:cytochrome C oxidoreductase [Candidatus Krumholzibacteria bacterium]HRY39579.1 quinol:cytochrome C oxidoreductase [Candidatus Krumholzibacteria bacterium]
MNEQTTATLGAARIDLGDLGPRLFRGGLVVGFAALAAAVALGWRDGDQLRHFSFSWLVSFAFFLSISLGALVFLPIQYVTRSSWSVVVRRLAEVIAMALPFLAILALPVLLNLGRVYDWASPQPRLLTPDLAAHKAPFLDPTFFVVRWVFYFAVWTWLALFYWRTSRRQDRTRDAALTRRLVNRSGAAILIFALTCSLAGMDLLMTLDPAWFSTIFGVYYWAGGFVAFSAVLTLITVGLQRSGRLVGIVTAEHFHDYGKLMFAFTFFWAYLAFSQYMLYWYSNIPEETAWYLVRQQSGWQRLGLLLVVGAFLLPFAGLISRFAKRSRPLLVFWAVWIIVLQWFNLYWVAMPVFSPDHVPLGPVDLSCFLAVGGFWIASVSRLAAADRLVPVGDPRLQDSLSFENA